MDPGRDTGRKMLAVSLRHNVLQPGKLSKFPSPRKTERMGQESRRGGELNLGSGLPCIEKTIQQKLGEGPLT